jgi:cytochrome b561
MKTVTRYHALLVILHWTLAVLIVGMLVVGFFSLAQTPNTDPAKITVLEVHMAIGMLILALMVIRFIVRLATARPQELTSGNRLADRVAPLIHWGFYAIVAAMVATGYATGILANLPAIVFQRTGQPLPADFMAYLTFQAHGLLAAILVGFVGLHVLAALHHQFVRKDGLLRRMALGRRTFQTQGDPP